MRIAADVQNVDHCSIWRGDYADMRRELHILESGGEKILFWLLNADEIMKLG